MKIGSHVGLALCRWNVLVYDRKHRDMNRIAQGLFRTVTDAFDFSI